jgi:hypothetical protein
MAIFGNNAVPTAIGYNPPGNTVSGGQYMSPADMGVVTQLTVYCELDVATTFKGIIALASTGVIVANGISNEGAIGGSAWTSVTFAVNPVLSPNTNYILYIIAPGYNIIDISDYSTGAFYYQTGNNYAAPTNPTAPTYMDARNACIYCTYTSSYTRTVTITSNAATLITANTVQLNGNLLDIADATSVVLTFDYGLTNAYGSTITAIESPLNANGTFSANVSSLVPANTYHFRAKGVS